ncbi:ABC transporter substrate-binding protein [Oharaeibacter diazotrophicus]|uniref:Multiple sugar transport system substrate-binding protein n=1 Tax=Oharaeibacter diazotrophicus TaxID=1920512 RepID=A0A4R6RAF1_9HYPH|nr:sugar ABC transporter substrate-binding protein [Oharaeibacter diazotrophicus]TDP83070.1 multiple sugar transport system substrate-binding protein [Oharaeibacter diazotrophicus]BBE71901.1 putative ABC transporter-binding protein precursor [Pleomorphomonas sp. SM30]GLS78664.1 sugar ABC transporter substrate-binding protein [Oharaeibacter diazotrophicus]
MTLLRFSSRRTIAAVAAFAFSAGGAAAADITLNVASMNDPFGPAMAKIAGDIEAKTGVALKVDIMGYGELMTKTSADFAGDTGGYDIVTMDNVLTGQYATSDQVIDLKPLIDRDAAELALDDIYPAVMNSLGGYEGKQVAFPFEGYANVLVYRTDLFAAAGLEPPATMQALQAAAIKVTDRDKGQYGWVANGQKGPAVAQDWMQYNAQLGGSILDAEGKPAINSEANVKSLAVYKEFFDKAAPPGAVDYDWGGREESFRQGVAATMQTWSVGAAAYGNPEQSKVVGKFAVMLAPPGEGVPPKYGVGGWGLSINKDIAPERQEAAWKVIKYLTSAEGQKALAEVGAGGFTRKSVLADPDLVAKFPFLPVIAASFEKGDGDYRPRIPEYPEIQDILGTAVNAVLAGNADPKAALDDAQARALELF